MDNYKAQQLEKILVGKKITTYTIEKLLNNGKSAAVFKAHDKSGNYFAVKIFDNDLVERFGHEIQSKRIEQEISLKGHSIKNLVKILDGGKTQIDSAEYYYIIMEFVSGDNLKDYITNQQYDNSILQDIVKTLFSTTETLLKIGIVHRDIKPENIMVTDAGEIILMDLGVLKLVGVKSFSDLEEMQFVGTLRYAPPEFLTRQEEDSNEGWRAVNLYQIGAVLHDLIMKDELFSNITPYTNLVIAIKENAPKITNSLLPYTTIQITRDLLIKDWKQRLAICPTERIENFISENPNDKTSIEKEIEEILSITSENKSQFEEIEKITSSNREKAEKRSTISNNLQTILNNCFLDLVTKGVYNKFEKSENFYFDYDVLTLKSEVTKNIVYKLHGDLKHGYLRDLSILVRVTNDENSLATISLLAIFFKSSIQIDLRDPRKTFRDAFPSPSRLNQIRTNSVRSPTMMHVAFRGTVGIDNEFEKVLTLEIIKLIKTALKGVADEVKAELDNRENYAKGENTARIRVVSGSSQNKTFHSTDL